MEVDAMQQDHFDPVSLFDTSLTGFPWCAPIPREIETRRARMSDVLIFDILLVSGGIRNPDSLYPPTDVPSLRFLLKTIIECTYDNLKKDCLIYFLLKWHQDGRDKVFRVQKSIPAQFVALADAYWYIDTGIDVSRGVSILADARLNRDYTSKILQAISLSPNPSPIIRRYIRTAKPLLTEPDDIDTYANALMESSLLEAWQYQRTFPEGSETRARLIKNILKWCLVPKPRSKPLTQLLAYSFSPYEQKLIHNYALDPPHTIPSTSIPIIQELVIVRLIQAGKYAAAVKLDRQFSLVIPASSASSHIQAVPTSARSEQIKKGAKNRKDMIDEIMQVMPRAERELLELELQKMVPSAPSVGASSSIGDLSGSGSFGDLSMSMSMSWESIRGPAGSLGNPSPSSSFVTVPNPNGLEGSSSSLKSQNQKQGANTKDSSTHPSNPLLRKPRVADTSFVPIPQRSGAPRFGGPPPIVPITSPGRGVVGSGQTTRPPIAGVAISGVLRAARGIPQFDGAPSPPQGQGQVGERKSLFETVGSANRARNAFFDPQMQTQTISGTVPSEGPTTSAGAKRPFGVLQRDFAGSANASGRGTRMSFGSGLGGVGMEDVSSASANAVLQELLAEDGQDSDIEIEESGVSGVEPQEPREKVQDKGDVEMGSGSERGRSSSPIRPPKSKGKAKAMRSVPGADVENQLDSSTVTKEFSFSVFSPTPPTGAPESPAAPSHPVATSGLGRKSPGGVKAPEKIARSETWMNMPPGAFIPDDVHEKAVSSVHHPLPSPAKSSKARRKEPTTTTSSTMERATRATGRPRRSVKKRETGQKLSFPGSLISDDDDLSHSDRDLEEEEEETNHLPPMQTLRSSPRKRRGTRTSEADMDEQEGEDVVMPLPPATPARRQPARKSRPSTGATPQKSGAATAKKKRESAGVVKEGRTTRRSTRLSSVVLPSTVEERGGSESPEPISPVKGRRAAGSKASGGGTGTGIAASVSAERGSKGRSSGKKGR